MSIVVVYFLFSLIVLPPPPSFHHLFLLIFRTWPWTQIRQTKVENLLHDFLATCLLRRFSTPWVSKFSSHDRNLSPGHFFRFIRYFSLIRNLSCFCPSVCSCCYPLLGLERVFLTSLSPLSSSPSTTSTVSCLVICLQSRPPPLLCKCGSRKCFSSRVSSKQTVFPHSHFPLSLKFPFSFFHFPCFLMNDCSYTKSKCVASILLRNPPLSLHHASSVKAIKTTFSSKFFVIIVLSVPRHTQFRVKKSLK